MEVEMSVEEVAFFGGPHAGALPLWAALRARLLERLPDTELRVRRTQIGLVARHVYGAVSFLPALRKVERPDPFLTVTSASRGGLSTRASRRRSSPTRDAGRTTSWWARRKRWTTSSSRCSSRRTTSP